MIESSNDITPEKKPEEVAFEQSLRPKSLEEYIGQSRLKSNLAIVMSAAKSRNQPLEHILLYGPPGLGKTTLAHIIAREMGGMIKTTSGPAIEKAGDLAALLTNLESGDVLFIDEIHRMSRLIEELLYPALEDSALDIILGKGPGAKSVRIDLPPFTLIGATTRAGLLSNPLRDRFGLLYHLDFYSPEEISEITSRTGNILGLEINQETARLLANRSRLTPRIANRLVRRLRDFAQVQGHSSLSPELAEEALKLLDIDHLGLDRQDRNLLEIILHKFGGGPVGLSTLSAALGEEQDTITDVYEPFLIRQGLLARTNKGRVITPLGTKHLNVDAASSGLLL